MSIPGLVLLTSEISKWTPEIIANLHIHFARFILNVGDLNAQRWDF